MATVTGCGMQRAGKTAGPVSSSQISALRVRPFTTVRNGRKHAALVQPKLTRPKAAETEAPAAPAEDELDFVFSLSEAKRNNEYSPSDVEAALKAYFDGVGSLDFNRDFIVNPWGTEDASFHSDLDDQDGYGDEYAAAGIAEAAPRRRRSGDDDAEENELVDAAKEAAAEGQLKDEIELRNIQSDLEDAGVFDKTSRQIEEEQRRQAEFELGVWDWMAAGSQEPEGDLADLEKITAARDVDLYDNLATADQVVGDLDETTKDIISFLVEDDLENFAGMAMDQDDDAEDNRFDVDTTPLAADDTARIEALMAELDGLVSASANMTVAPRETMEPVYEALDERIATQYIADLKSVTPVALSEEQLKKLLDLKDANGAPIAEIVAMDDLPNLSDLPEVDLNEKSNFKPLSEDQLVVVDDSTEPDLKELGITDIVKSIKELEEFALPEFVPPSEEELDGLEQYLVSCQQYVDDDEARKKAILEAVQRGELPVEVLEEDEDDRLISDGAPPLDLFVDDDELVADDIPDEDEQQWLERVVELKRVTKVVKGGKLMGFRAVAIVGNQKGLVGVGCSAGREIATAVKRALVDAKKHIIRVPLVGAGTVPHRMEAKFNAARVVIRPAADGTGCIAGGSVRQVLELAGIKNALAKRMGSRSLLNNARCTIAALSAMQPLYEVSKYRGIPMEELLLKK